ncbi:N amino acid transport system [Fusarium albosuccineum]|uniref:N amino acid transport system n=1 Tax=Fusarium albosuccineum TaxID=1237068 RepID=A0A8H4L7A6_9HYPO|nr:N amino acid transport system [Fusarium albosuccineum]
MADQLEAAEVQSGQAKTQKTPTMPSNEPNEAFVGGTIPSKDGTVLGKTSTCGMGEVDPEDRFHRLGWKRLAAILVVEAVALGALSLPAAFETLGMVFGVLVCVGLGVVPIYASCTIGEVKLEYSNIKHYADMSRLLMRRLGFHFFNFAFVIQLTLVVGSHCLTGKSAFVAVTNSGVDKIPMFLTSWWAQSTIHGPTSRSEPPALSEVCSPVFSIVSTLALILLAIPPSFAEIATLGYIDFISLIGAVGWSAWPKEGVTLAEVINAITNVVFVYAFAAAIPSFMDDLHTPKDYRKSAVALGITEISIYTFTGVILYAIVGQDAQAPTLLLAGPLISKVGFGIAFPLIFTSGSINITVICRFVYGQIEWGPMIRLAAAGSAVDLGEWFAFDVLGVLASYLGTEYLAAQAILNSGCVIMWHIPVSISVAVTSRIGHLIGNGLTDTARRAATLYAVVFVGVGCFNGSLL